MASMHLARLTVLSLCVTFATLSLGNIGGVVARVSGAAAVSSHMEEDHLPAPVNAPETVVPASFHSSWVSQSDPMTLGAGSSGKLVVRFRNTGTASWVKGITGQQANLALSGGPSPLASGWLAADRVASQSEAVVAPGAIGTFAFEVRAPAEAGTYRLSLRPVIDGTTWMEDQGVFLGVESQAVAASQPTLPSSSTAMAIFGVLMFLLGMALLDLVRSLARTTRSRIPSLRTTR